MSEEDDARHQKQRASIVAAFNAADWVYHDARLDIDGQAVARTMERLQAFHEEFGKDALYGIVCAWALKAYWRLQDALARRGLDPNLRLIPGNMLESISNDNEKKRAYISAQQLISSIAANDFDMADAIFSAAYDSGMEDVLSLLYCVLMLSVKISTDAKKMGTPGK